MGEKVIDVDLETFVSVMEMHGPEITLGTLAFCQQETKFGML